MDRRVLFTHLPEQFNHLAFTQLLDALIAHGVSEIFELRYGFVFVQRFVHLAAPIKQHLHGFVLQFGTPLGNVPVDVEKVR